MNLMAYTDEERELLADCDVTTFRASGPGGQHRNVTDSAVRLIHRPSGIMVTCSGHRSQHRNRREALQVLARRLAAARRRRKPRLPTRPSRSSKETRLQEKKQRSVRKRNRRAVDPE